MPNIRRSPEDNQYSRRITRSQTQGISNNQANKEPFEVYPGNTIHNSSLLEEAAAFASGTPPRWTRGSSEPPQGNPDLDTLASNNQQGRNVPLFLPTTSVAYLDRSNYSQPPANLYTANLQVPPSFTRQPHVQLPANTVAQPLGQQQPKTKLNPSVAEFITQNSAKNVDSFRLDCNSQNMQNNLLNTSNNPLHIDNSNNVNPNYAVYSSSCQNKNNFPSNHNFNLNNNFNNNILDRADKLLPIFEDNDRLHPVDFINSLEQTIHLYNIPNRLIAHWSQSLFQGKAKPWADALLFAFPDFISLKIAFLEQFWGFARQAKIKLQLEIGKYDRKLSYSNYFLEQVALSRHITGYTEIQLVALISRHFSPIISSSLIGSQTIADALNKLRLAEHYETDYSIYNSSREYRNSPHIRGDRDKFVHFKQAKNPTEDSYKRVNVIGDLESHEDVFTSEN